MDSGVVTVALTVARTAGVTITPTTGLTTSEDGGTASFTIVLDGPPTQPVTITLATSAPREGALSRTVLVFDSSNWNVPQTVRVTGINDSSTDADTTYVITASAASVDARYQDLALPGITVTNVAAAPVAGPGPDPGPAPVPGPPPPQPAPEPPVDDPGNGPRTDDNNNDQPEIIVTEPRTVPGVDTPGEPGPPDKPVAPPEDPPKPVNPVQPDPGNGKANTPDPVEKQPPAVPDGGETPAPVIRIANPTLAVRLDAMARQIGSRGKAEPMTVRAVKQTFVAITVGYVVWSLRGASLLASLLTSMPLWRSLDPLPILENRVALMKKKKKQRRRWFGRRGAAGSSDQPLGDMVK
jgi:hypothetical protein